MAHLYVPLCESVLANSARPSFPQRPPKPATAARPTSARSASVRPMNTARPHSAAATPRRSVRGAECQPPQSPRGRLNVKLAASRRPSSAGKAHTPNLNELTSILHVEQSSSPPRSLRTDGSLPHGGMQVHVRDRDPSPSPPDPAELEPVDLPPRVQWWMKGAAPAPAITAMPSFPSEVATASWPTAPRATVKAQTTPRDLPPRPGRWRSCDAPLARERLIVRSPRTFAEPSEPTAPARAELLDRMLKLLRPQLEAMQAALAIRTPSAEACEACIQTLVTLAPLLGALQPTASHLARSAQTATRLSARGGGGGSGSNADGAYYFEAAALQGEELKELREASDNACQQRARLRRKISDKEAALAEVRLELGLASSRMDELVHDLAAKKVEAELRRTQQQQYHQRYEMILAEAAHATRMQLDEQEKLQQRLVQYELEIAARETAPPPETAPEGMSPVRARSLDAPFDAPYTGKDFAMVDGGAYKPPARPRNVSDLIIDLIPEVEADLFADAAASDLDEPRPEGVGAASMAQAATLA